jgi:5-methylcytosine-specific restriction endonuclease McrA
MRCTPQYGTFVEHLGVSVFHEDAVAVRRCALHSKIYGKHIQIPFTSSLTMKTDQSVPDLLDLIKSNPQYFQLGYVEHMDYHTEYLQSALWRKIKRRVLKRDSKICMLCSGEGTIVHHCSYDQEVLKGDADHLLVTVCEGCHNIIHFDDTGQKRPEVEWKNMHTQRQIQVNFPEPKIDLRRLSQRKPLEWPRMTAIQKNLWCQRARQLAAEKKVAHGHMVYEKFLKKT